MPKQLIVKGHRLRNEGRIYDAGGWRQWGQGAAKCSCGVLSSDALPSDSARQRWHREHKQAILDALKTDAS